MATRGRRTGSSGPDESTWAGCVGAHPHEVAVERRTKRPHRDLLNEDDGENAGGKEMPENGATKSPKKEVNTPSLHG